MAEKKFFTNESLTSFVDKIKLNTNNVISTHDTDVDAHSNMGWISSEDEVVDSPMPIDADTLNGHDSAYFATQESVDKLSNYVTPQMFGAKGDGNTDDTEAINYALSSGESVYFPAGVYYITSALNIPDNCVIIGAGEKSVIRSYVQNGYVLNGIDSGGNISTTITKVTIKELYFDNWCQQDSVTKMQSGNFAGTVNSIYMSNCRVNGYANVFDTIKLVSRIVNNRFTLIYQSFVRDIYDSIVDGNYISASIYGAPYGSKCFSYECSATTISNNFIDYFYDCFAAKHFYPSKIIGNTFSRIVNVFHDNIGGATISSNTFSFIKYVASDWSKLTEEQQATLQAEKWCAIKFDNGVVNDSHMMTNLSFVNNVGNNCDNYIYVADNATIIASKCEFIGNAFTIDTYTPSAVNAGFRNWTTTEDAYNSFKNVYFDFWDMKEYDELPSPALYGNTAKSVVSFPYMKAIYNGELYINVKGEWKKLADAFSDAEDLFVTPQMFGAKANGSSDDTQAINDALASGLSVYFPEGKYYISSALIVPRDGKIFGSGRNCIIRTAINDGYVLNGIDSSGNISNTINGVTIEGLFFYNWNSADANTKLYAGDFVDVATGVHLRDCRFYNYDNIFNRVTDASIISGNYFEGVCGSFVETVYRSTVNDNTIQASVYAAPYKTKCFAYDITDSTVSNNFIHNFYDCFAVRALVNAKIIGNHFNNIVNVFHDTVISVVFANNTLQNICYVASTWSNLTEEQKTALQAEKWCAIKFDNAINASTHILANVNFTNNVSSSCDNYIYIEDGVDVIATECEFRGNKLTTGTNNGIRSAVDAGFRNWATTEDTYQSFKNVYFDFWDMKEYDELPSPILYINSPKSVVSFPYMKAIYNGELYININGEWRITSPTIYDGSVD